MSGTSRFGRSRVGLVALVAVLGLMALGPATASAGHFTGSTKECAAQNPVTKTFDCVLTVSVVEVSPSTPITVRIESSAVGAEFESITHTGGTCPQTASVTLRDSVNARITPSSNIGFARCTLVFKETLTSDDFGDVCQVLDTVGNFPPLRVCAQLLPPPLPTTKEQCKNEGFRNFGGVFRNQGDCVSFVATKGKNEPGKNLPTP